MRNEKESYVDLLRAVVNDRRPCNPNHYAEYMISRGSHCDNINTVITGEQALPQRPGLVE
jgi:hypothetical protein